MFGGTWLITQLLLEGEASEYSENLTPFTQGTFISLQNCTKPLKEIKLKLNKFNDRTGLD